MRHNYLPISILRNNSVRQICSQRQRRGGIGAQKCLLEKLFFFWDDFFFYFFMTNINLIRMICNLFFIMADYYLFMTRFLFLQRSDIFKSRLHLLFSKSKTVIEHKISQKHNHMVNE